mgnify:CR=1 FL=1
MSDKIKVALCLSGEPRSSMFCFPYIYETFINLGPEYEVDVYIHTRKGFRALEMYNPKKYLIDTTDENELWDNYFNHLATNFSKTIEYKLTNNNQNNIRNLYLMVLGINKCFNLIDNPEEYNIIIRSRLDIIVRNKFFTHSIINSILHSKFNLFIPSGSFNDNLDKIYIDQVAIGNPFSIRYYSDLIHNIDQTLTEVKNFHPESWYYNYLNSNKSLKIYQDFMFLNLIRKSFITSFPSLNNFLDE